MELPLSDLLKFVDECDVSDTEVQPPPHDIFRQSLSAKSPVYTTEKLKKRPRRDLVEIASLRTHVRALSLELADIRARRHGRGSETLVASSSHWQREIQSQSRRRSTAQAENERLRAKLRMQIQIAKRLTNAFRRNSASKVLRMVQDYEGAALLRAQKSDLGVDLEHMYCQADAMLADADMLIAPPVFCDTQIHQKNCSGMLSIVFRRSLRVPFSCDTANDTYWHFMPHQSFDERFIFKRSVSYLNDSVDCDFLFQCQTDPNRSHFTGRYQWRRYKTDERVLIVWKSLIKSLNYSTLQMHGHGCVVIQSANVFGVSTPCTSVKGFARYDADTELKALSIPEQAQLYADLRVLVDFLTVKMDGYDAFPTQM